MTASAPEALPWDDAHSTGYNGDEPTPPWVEKCRAVGCDVNDRSKLNAEGFCPDHERDDPLDDRDDSEQTSSISGWVSYEAAQRTIDEHDLDGASYWPWSERDDGLLVRVGEAIPISHSYDLPEELEHKLDGVHDAHQDRHLRGDAAYDTRGQTDFLLVGIAVFLVASAWIIALTPHTLIAASLLSIAVVLSIIAFFAVGYYDS